MKRTIQWITVTVALALAGLGLTAQGQTIFVAADGTNDVAGNFDTWAGSATNIHEAVDLANSLGRNVMVSNGVYRLTNELAVSTGITVQSLNGPDETTIYRDATYGNFRIFNVSHADALVSGFTVTNGFLNNLSGAGFHMTAGTVSNCVISLSAVSTGITAPSASLAA